MGDLPGSPSVAPSPLFCTAPLGGGGGEPRRAPRLPRLSRMVRNRTAWASGGFHAAPEGTDRWSTPPPEGGMNRGGVYTALRSAVGGRGAYAFFSVFFLLFSSCFLPRFFASGRGALLRGPGCGIRRRPEKWQSHPAPCGGAEERRANAGSVRLGSSVPGWPPSPPPRPGDVR